MIYLGCYSMTVWFAIRHPNGMVLLYGVTTLGNGLQGITIAAGYANPREITS